jgi:uncharacterized protein (TIGR00255 family)
VLSMTGYGKQQQAADGREITVEIKTVNHRFLDISCKLPRCLGFMENEIRKQIGQWLKRGHADIYIQYRNMREDARTVSLDSAYAKALEKAFSSLKQVVHISGDERLADYTAFPDMFSINEREEDQEAVSALVLSALYGALDETQSMRAREGEMLKRDLIMHLDLLESLTDRISVKAPEVTANFFEKLTARLNEADISPVDPQRLAQEVAIFADRSAIDEELARLCSHISQMRSAMDEPCEVGRKLDFLTQEMNREVNTISAKAQDIDIIRSVLEAKGEIEKLREQGQNVE